MKFKWDSIEIQTSVAMIETSFSLLIHPHPIILIPPAKKHFLELIICKNRALCHPAKSQTALTKRLRRCCTSQRCNALAVQRTQQQPLDFFFLLFFAWDFIPNRSLGVGLPILKDCWEYFTTLNYQMIMTIRIIRIIIMISAVGAMTCTFGT